MKRILLVALLFCFICGVPVRAQVLKFAHINSQELLKAMPENDSAKRKLKSFEEDVMEQMDQLNVEVNKKYQEYMQKKESLSPSLKEAKEKEIQDLQQRLQEYNMAAQKDYQDLSAKLMQPIIDRAQQAIKKVGKANGYIYVFDSSVGVLLYQSEQSTDILPLVKKELGIK